RLGVHPGYHQHLAAVGILHDGGDEAALVKLQRYRFTGGADHRYVLTHGPLLWWWLVQPAARARRWRRGKPSRRESGGGGSGTGKRPARHRPRLRETLPESAPASPRRRRR